MSAYNFVHSGPNFTEFFLFNAQKIVQRPKDCSRQRRLHIFAIFIGFRDICVQT